ncbi:hypothetical protein MKW94_015293, partial [Papaver nudicaule]|nr:hypothetical protein [Papaver nudicaule]
LSTMDNLHRRNMALTSSSSCQLCSNNIETVVHLLIGCPVVFDIWCYFLRSAGRRTVLPQSVQALFVSWKRINSSEQGKQLWRRLPAAIMWVIWLSRNAKIYAAKEIKVSDIIRDIKIHAFNWAKGASCFAGIDTSTVIVGWDQFFRRP